MLRNSGNIIRKVPSSLGRNVLQQQNRSASGVASTAGGVFKALLYTTGAVAAGAGGTVGYAYYDPEFRRSIEKTIPQSKDVLHSILGEPRDSSKPLVDFPAMKGLGDKISSVLPAKKEQKDTASPSMLPKPSATSPAVTEPSPDKPQPTKPLKDLIVPIESAPSKDSPKKESPTKDNKKDEKLSSPKKDQPTSIAGPAAATISSAATSSSKSSSSTKPTPTSSSFDNEEAKLRAEFEEELLKQMRRQASAHREHLEDVLEAQRHELEARGKREMDEAVIKERDMFNREIANSIARLQAIEAALEGRAEQDSENRRAKELWIACQHLRRSVLHGRIDGRDYNSRRKPLTKEVVAIKEAGAADPFVKTLANTIQSEALSDGVYTQDDLINRFEKVKKICRRTALIGENGGTLFQYFLSLVQSYFLFDRVKPDARQLLEVDPANTDTVGILWRAAYLVDQLDFDSAIKLMLLLKGEPGRLASDWIRDARLHLETRKTAELLLAHAAAMSMRTIY